MVGTIYLLILVAAFVGIVVWVFGAQAQSALRGERQDSSRRKKESLTMANVGGFERGARSDKRIN